MARTASASSWAFAKVSTSKVVFLLLYVDDAFATTKCSCTCAACQFVRHTHSQNTGNYCKTSSGDDAPGNERGNGRLVLSQFKDGDEVRFIVFAKASQHCLCDLLCDGRTGTASLICFCMTLFDRRRPKAATGTP